MICKVDGDEMAEYTPYSPDVVEEMQLTSALERSRELACKLLGFENLVLEWTSAREEASGLVRIEGLDVERV